MSNDKAPQINPGKAGPKGALAEPTAKSKRKRGQQGNFQPNFVKLTKAERKRTRLDGSN
jgi:hypothetical protein